MKQKLACNIMKLKDLTPPTPTFEEMIAESQKTIDTAPSLAELAEDMFPLFPEKD